MCSLAQGNTMRPMPLCPYELQRGTFRAETRAYWSLGGLANALVVFVVKGALWAIRILRAQQSSQAWDVV